LHVLMYQSIISFHTGTNFEILPELTWGVDPDHIGQPPGFPLGYCFFWGMMILVGMICFMALKRLKVF